MLYSTQYFNILKIYLITKRICSHSVPLRLTPDRQCPEEISVRVVRNTAWVVSRELYRVSWTAWVQSWTAWVDNLWRILPECYSYCDDPVLSKLSQFFVSSRTTLICNWLHRLVQHIKSSINNPNMQSKRVIITLRRSRNLATWLKNSSRMSRHRTE